MARAAVGSARQGPEWFHLAVGRVGDPGKFGGTAAFNVPPRLLHQDGRNAAAGSGIAHAGDHVAIAEDAHDPFAGD